jgi:hypothetical protein
MAGKQCLKRLYLECYHRDLMTPPGAAQQLLFTMGSRLGVLARECYPGGVLIEEDYRHHAEASRSTRRAMARPSVPAVFEAAFAHDDVAIRADVLVRDGEGTSGGEFGGPHGWGLVEVKSGSGLKEEHIWDAAIQLHVLRGCGVPVRSVGVMHLDGAYVYPGGRIDPRDLFVVEDVTLKAEALAGALIEDLARMRAALAGGGPPAIRPSRHCLQPYTCPFSPYCASDAPSFPVWQLPGADRVLLERLAGEGIEDIRLIPEGFAGLSPLQCRVRECVRTGTVYFDHGAAAELNALEHPVHFLDFESFAPAVPVFPGTRPYQQTVFQFSDHILEADGSVGHAEYLHPPGSDPREPLARALLDAVGDTGSIATYSQFERVAIVRLAEHLPHLSWSLGALLPRLVDLLPIVRRSVYHSGFRGSFSIKSVLPAMVPGPAYDHLEIAEGSLASFSYQGLVEGALPAQEAQATLDALRAYCARDTQAMLELFTLLKAPRPT